MKSIFCFFLFSFISSPFSKVFFKESFVDIWTKRWVQSKSKSDYGEFKLSHGNFYGDAKKDLGIQTSEDAHFYAISAKFDKFSNRDKDLVLQFSVKHEQNIDCGGGYIKLLPSFDLEKFNGDTEYAIMFGPDICGGTKRTHVIINYKGENWLIEKTIKPETDVLTHVYTLVLKPDQSYQVLIDQKEVASGKIDEDWKMLGSKKLKILMPKNQKTGMMFQKLQIQMMPNQLIGRMNQNSLMIQKLKNQKIGMMKWTELGKILKSQILNTKVNGALK